MRPKENEPQSSDAQEQEEERNSRKPSTSTANQDCSIDDATTIFERLHITQEKPQKERKSHEKKDQGEQKPQGSPIFQSHRFSHQFRFRWRWCPYSLPKRYKTLRNDADVIKVLERIKWKEEVDVDELRNRLLVAMPCSVEASRVSTQQDHEVDELAEYFGCFVCVETKMSALAESMYC